MNVFSLFFQTQDGIRSALYQRVRLTVCHLPTGGRTQGSDIRQYCTVLYCTLRCNIVLCNKNGLPPIIFVVSVPDENMRARPSGEVLVRVPLRNT